VIVGGGFYLRINLRWSGFGDKARRSMPGNTAGKSSGFTEKGLKSDSCIIARINSPTPFEAWEERRSGSDGG
jgi:hypothetical protein